MGWHIFDRHLRYKLKSLSLKVGDFTFNFTQHNYAPHTKPSDIYFCASDSIKFNSGAREWRHDSGKTQTNKLEWWIKISLRDKAGVPKILVKQKARLHSL